MQWINSATRFGLMAIALHWLVALSVFGLFGLGLWMTGLDYYDNWYKQGPWLHKSIGVLLFFTLVFRICWRLLTPPPAVLSSHKQWEVKISHVIHLLFYLLLLLIMLSGYLISTEDNRSIEVFNWFSIPASITTIPNQADVAGWVHLILACSVMGLVLLHAMAALKHHFVDRDQTLNRIIGR